jgi:hypothetical protein
VARIEVGRALGDAAVSGFMVWLMSAIAAPFGQGRARTGWSATPGMRFQVWPPFVYQHSPEGGETTAPATGRPFSIRPMLTVKWGSPRTKALVPSSGSTRKKRGPMASGVPNSLASSSEITGTSGNR